MISRALNCMSKNFLPGTGLVLSIHDDYGGKVQVNPCEGEMVYRNDRLPEVMGKGKLHKQIDQRSAFSMRADKEEITLDGKSFYLYHGKQSLFQFR